MARQHMLYNLSLLSQHFDFLYINNKHWNNTQYILVPPVGSVWQSMTSLMEFRYFADGCKPCSEGGRTVSSAPSHQMWFSESPSAHQLSQPPHPHLPLPWLPMLNTLQYVINHTHLTLSRSLTKFNKTPMYYYYYLDVLTYDLHLGLQAYTIYYSSSDQA